MMYYYWKTKGIRPFVFYNMSAGEKLFVRACYELEIEEETKKPNQGKCPFSGLFRKK